MWILLAFVSATLLGLYDTSKKYSLRGNDVIPVLFLNTLFCPINATRPVMTLVGAMLVFGERLNGWQWIGVCLAIVSLFLLARSGKKEGIDFKHNKWIFFLVLAALMGTCSGLLDKYLMASPEDGGVGLDRMMAQSWYNIYQCVMMGLVLLIYLINNHKSAACTFLLEMVYSAYFYLLVNGRLRLFLCTITARSNDIYSVDGSSRFCTRLIRVWSCIVQREKSKGKSH